MGAGEKLEGVFRELQQFQRSVARRQCLESLVAVAERTEKVREAVFACRGADDLPLNALEEIPEHCKNLPPRSRKLAHSRLRFVIDPLRTTLVQALDNALVSTESWPLALGNSRKEGADGSRVIRLCADLLRVQRVEGYIPREPKNSASDQLRVYWGDVDADEGLWACRALCAPLCKKFRQLFCDPASDLCRMDKPEWAFRYLTENLLGEHRQLLESWLGSEMDGLAGTCQLSKGQSAALEDSDIVAGLAAAIAREGRMFVRSRVPELAKSEDEPLLLETLKHLVRFHSDVSAAGGEAAGAALFADFDANRPLVPPPPAPARPQRVERAGTAEASADGARTASSPDIEGRRRPDEIPTAGSGAGGRIRVRDRLFRGLSQLSAAATGGASSQAEDPFAHLRKPDAGRDAEAAREPESASGGAVGGSPGSAPSDWIPHLSSGIDDVQVAAPRGFLDLWTSVDATFMADKLGSAISSGSAWRPKALMLGTQNLQGPEAANLAPLLADLLRVSSVRAQCLCSRSARAIYSSRVLEAALEQAVSAIKSRWNAMDDVFSEDACSAALLVETMEEVCRFLDGSPLAEYFLNSVDEANALRLSMMGKLAESMVDLVAKKLRWLDSEPSLLSFVLTAPLASLSKRLRLSNFRLVAQQTVAKLAAALSLHLQHDVFFPTESQAAIFAANCGDDLRDALSAAAAVLDEAEMAPIRPIREAASLLALSKSKAEELLALLKRVELCSPSPPDMFSEQSMVPNVTLERTGTDALLAVGVKELSSEEAIAVLSKRATLSGADAQDKRFGALQELLPAHAAQGALQLSVGALQQLSELSSQAQVPMPVAAMAHATLQKSALGVAALAGGAQQTAGQLVGRFYRSSSKPV